MNYYSKHPHIHGRLLELLSGVSRAGNFVKASLLLGTISFSFGSVRLFTPHPCAGLGTSYANSTSAPSFTISPPQGVPTVPVGYFGATTSRSFKFRNWITIVLPLCICKANSPLNSRFLVSWSVISTVTFPLIR